MNRAFGFKWWDKSRNLLLTKPVKFQLTGRLLKFAILHELFVPFKTWLFPVSHTLSSFLAVHTFLPTASSYVPNWVKYVYVELNWHHLGFNI